MSTEKMEPVAALDNIKAALYRYYAAVEGVLATQAAEDPHAIALAIQEAEKSTRLLETWTQPDYIQELLAYVESLEAKAARSEAAAAAFEREQDRADAAEIRAELAEKDAARYRWLRDNLDGDWAICEWCNKDEAYFRDRRKPHVVDAAIDAAMEQTK